MSRGLSEWALSFVDACPKVSLGGSFRRESVALNDSLIGAEGDLERMLSKMARFEERYGGLVVPVRGGVLAGSLTLGFGATPAVRRSDDGEPIIRMASHDSAQCAIVMSADGRVGCSWSGEFHHLFDSVEHLIEDCAAWHRIRGWWYAAVSDFDQDLVMSAAGGGALDDSVSGEKAQWRRADGIAVVSHPYLNPGRGASVQVAVLAADALKREWLKRKLESHGFGGQGETAASLLGRVG
ncbi:hypothetical protein [Streptomyces sp. NPDC001678]|uniref:hypothetical protein n=1 Tax=Streptomyces sp. NPDC001678 TaxID=3364599 RepID=UPI0036BFDED1